MTAWWRKNKNDDYSTPVEYLEIINKYVSIDKVICDPFYMNGSVKVVFQNHSVCPQSNGEWLEFMVSWVATANRLPKERQIEIYI